MQLSLHKFLSVDQLELPGLLYEPIQKTTKAVINLHGNGSTSVFYSVERSNFFGKHLTKSGISYFTFNNRGAHYLKSLKKVVSPEEKERIILGSTYELIKDCVYDIDGAINYLKTLGYTEFYLLGHSTGANKICVYNHYKPQNVISKYILAGSGDDMGIYYNEVGKKKFFEILEISQKMIKNGKGEKLVPKKYINYPISYQSLFDTINPDGDYNNFPFNEYLHNLKLSKKPLFKEFYEITKPTLVIYGEFDYLVPESVETGINIMKKFQNKNTEIEYKIVKGADHSFGPNDEEYAIEVTKWLCK